MGFNNQLHHPKTRLRSCSQTWTGKTLYCEIRNNSGWNVANPLTLITGNHTKTTLLFLDRKHHTLPSCYHTPNTPTKSDESSFSDRSVLQMEDLLIDTLLWFCFPCRHNVCPALRCLKHCTYSRYRQQQPVWVLSASSWCSQALRHHMFSECCVPVKNRHGTSFNSLYWFSFQSENYICMVFLFNVSFSQGDKTKKTTTILSNRGNKVASSCFFHLTSEWP